MCFGDSGNVVTNKDLDFRPTIAPLSRDQQRAPLSRATAWKSF